LSIKTIVPNPDLEKETIFPTLHYQNGGLKFNESGETAIPWLFAAVVLGWRFWLKRADYKSKPR